ncbi:MAG: magnesium/cobalt transporter CorA [Syntrophobacterales bacterium]|nr:magnesium/cobalt transporter CorA [Syntrophobacterales bacterium]
MKKNGKRKRSRENPRSGKKAGLAPGTPVFIGERKQDKTNISILDYSRDHLEDIPEATLADCARFRIGDNIAWINVNGIHDVSLIQNLATLFGLHPLTAEDIANTSQRPKVEEFGDYIFFVIKIMTYSEDTAAIDYENVSIILGKNFVLSFRERDSDILDHLKERIRAGKGSIRGEKADHLAYAIMDAVIDEYFLAIEKVGDHIEDLDDEILTSSGAVAMQKLHRLKWEVLFLRKAIWPLREEISAIAKSESPLIGASTRIFLRDLYDHTIEIIDMVETYRDIIGGMHDTFLSSISNRMNQVMKVLTIIGTIFIPLTFIAGVYGMNFEYMPELKWKWGYFTLLGFMAALVIIMLALFKRRKWL